MSAVDDFLAAPLVARIATSAPSVRPVWFLWDGDAFWWLTGSWSRLPAQVEADSRVALVVDTCDLTTGRVLHVSSRGQAEVRPLDRAIAYGTLSKYLGPDIERWPKERFLTPLEDPTTRLVRLRPIRPPVLGDLSF